MFPFLGEVELNGYPIRMGRCQILQTLLKATFAASQEDELSIHFPNGATPQNQVHALLGYHAGHHADEESVGIFRQPELLLKGCLTHGLPREVFGGIGGRNIGVCGGIPDTIVDSV